MVFTLYRHVPVCLFTPERFTLPGAPGDLSGGLPGHYSNSPAWAWEERRQVYLVDWLQGTWIRQEANGQQVTLLLWSSSGRPFLLSRDQTCPSSPSPASGVFFQHPSGTRKDLVYQNQGSVFNIIMTAVKTVNFTQNQVEERTSQGQVWGQETDPLLSTVPGDYRNPLVSTLGAQPAETWCPNQGLWDPPQVRGLGRWCHLGKCGSMAPGAGSEDYVGLTHTWSGICTQKPYISFLPAVCLVPSEIPNVWIEGVALINPWPFSSLQLWHSYAVRHLCVGCCCVFCWVKTFVVSC